VKPNLVIAGGSGLLAVNWALQMRGAWNLHLLFHNREVSIPGVEGGFADLSSPQSVLKALKGLKPDLVVNTVALANVDECQRDCERATHANKVVANNLALAAKALQSQFVHISTDHLFDGSTANRTETDEPKPQNHYGRTKLEAEKVVLAAHPDALVVRTNFFGWGPSYRRSFSDWIIDNGSLGKPLTLFTDSIITPIYMGRLIALVHKLLERDGSGVFNIVGNARLSKYEFALRLCQRLGYDQRLIVPKRLSERLKSNPDMAPRPLDMSLSNQKLVSLIGENGLDLDDMLDAMLQDREIAYQLAKLGE